MPSRYGTWGQAFPVTPNTGGFRLEDLRSLCSPGPTSERRLILLKGYENWAGRALHGLRAIEQCADVLRGFKTAIYSADDMVIEQVKGTRQEIGLDIDIVPRSSHEEMLRLHGQARMSIGINITDGVSTSFLEALAMGSFPIQTCTACADEWITDGETGFLVRPDDIAGIAAAIRRAATDDALVDRAAQINAQTALDRLEYGKIQAASIAMYRRVIADRATKGMRQPATSAATPPQDPA